jgi:hypothetical protein
MHKSILAITIAAAILLAGSLAWKAEAAPGGRYECALRCARFQSSRNGRLWRARSFLRMGTLVCMQCQEVLVCSLRSLQMARMVVIDPGPGLGWHLVI